LSDHTISLEWLRPALPRLVDEVIAAVQAAVPAYRVLDRNVRAGVRQALEGFIEITEGAASARLPARDVYVQFGRGEARSGRPLDALLGAYRANGLACVGVDETLKAFELGQVEELLITGVPETIDAGEPVASAEAPARTAEERAADTLIVQARNTSARVRFIEDASLLAAVGGVGAFLRFKL
jgi:hypothetical protein